MTEDWHPVTEEREDVVTAVAAAALHGLLDSPAEPPGVGEPLPPLWHWLAFLPQVPQRDLGPDGHPHGGSFLPSGLLPRRMFAGAQLRFPGSLRVGQPLQRRSVVTSVTEKTGRSGRLQFVEVTSEVDAGGGPAVIEVQNIVYRQPVATPATASAGPAAVGMAPAEEEGWPWRLDLGTEPSRLFRFSALTYNAHRIHYDRDYATGVEGYPGLVVHGPLQAVGLAELCRRHAGRPMATFSFRAVRPALDGAPLRLRGGWAGHGRAELVALDRLAQRTMIAEATFH